MRLALFIFCLVMTAPVCAAQRIIALAPHIVENLFAVGAGEQVVGIVEHSNYPAQASQLPLVGNHLQINIETVLALKPDLIIAWRKGNPESDLERLKTLGVTIEYSDPTTLEDIATELRWLGQLTQHEQQAEQRAAAFEAQLEALRKQYAPRSPIPAFYELWPSPLTTVAEGAWPQQFLDVCQLTNPFEDNPRQYPGVNLEQVVAVAPEIIIRPFDDARVEIAKTNWAKWTMIPAVKKQQFVWVDGDKLHRMTVRSVEALQSLCEATDAFR